MILLRSSPLFIQPALSEVIYARKAKSFLGYDASLLHNAEVTGEHCSYTGDVVFFHRPLRFPSPVAEVEVCPV